MDLICWLVIFLKVWYFQKRCQRKHESFKNIDRKDEKNAPLKSTTVFLVITGYLNMPWILTEYFRIKRATKHHLMSVQVMIRLHVFPIFSFLAKILSFLLRDDNIFARNENIEKICKRTITWTDFSPLLVFSIQGKTWSSFLSALLNWRRDNEFL